MSSPRVLYLHANEPCYLAESLLHGLRTTLGSRCVDVPRYDSLYAPLPDGIRTKLRGHGFTLYGLLADDPALAVPRFAWRNDLALYDLVVLASIWQQGELYAQLSRELGPDKLVVLDGQDASRVFPFAVRAGWRNWPLATRIRRTRYFKRELDLGTAVGRLLHRAHARSIAFSIPAEKVVEIPWESRVKDFPAQIPDAEVAADVRSRHLGLGETAHAFVREKDYLADLRSSRFGITMKRAGWDCLRHYELAAAGCVLCFRDLDSKPSASAPHGLQRENAVIYREADDLRTQLSALGEAERAGLSAAATTWVRTQTTEARAREFLAACL